MGETKKRTRPKKTELEKLIEKATSIGLKNNLHSIEIAGQFIITFKTPIINSVQTLEKPKREPKVNAAGIEINGLIPKEQLQNEEDMLFWSTPTYGMEKVLASPIPENEQ